MMELMGFRLKTWSSLWLIVNIYLRGLNGLLVGVHHNTIAIVGTDVTFSCSSTNYTQTINWIYNAPVQPMSRENVPLTLYNGIVLYRRIGVDAYNITGANGVTVHYNLIINDVQLGDAGMYTCQDQNGIGQPVHRALLTVLQNPVCTQPPKEISSNASVKLNCNVSFCGNYTLKLGWSCSDEPQNVQSSQPLKIVNNFTTTNYTTMTSIGVNASGKHYIDCSFNVNPETSQINDDNVDSNLPSFSYSLPVINMNVSYPVTVCNLTFHGNKADTTICPDSLLTASTSCGFPPPKIRWISRINETIILERNDVSSSDGVFNWTCVATNVVENVLYSINETIMLTVDTVGCENLTRTILIAVLVPVMILILIIIVGVVILLHKRKGKRKVSGSDDIKKESLENNSNNCNFFQKRSPEVEYEKKNKRNTCTNL